MLFLTQAIKYTLQGGISLKQLNRLRVTIKIEPVISYNTQVLRHSLDLYNNDQVEKLIHKCADSFEVSSNLIREELSQLLEEL